MKDFFEQMRLKAADWSNRLDHESPGLFTAGILGVAAALMIAHYTFGEVAFHPGLTLWKERAFWADIPMYAALPFLLWFGWKVVSLGKLNIARTVVEMTIALCVGDALCYIVPSILQSLQRLHYRFEVPVEIWHWESYWNLWTFWMPTVIVIGNLVFLKHWLALFGSTFSCRGSGTTNGKARGIGVFWKSLVLLTTLVALLLTIIHVGLPNMPINDTTVSLAETFLVPPRLQADFGYLTAGADYRGQRLGVILDHVELAGLQRRQFYQNSDDRVFQEYILSPDIDVLPLNELNWRRPLWKYFYPRVRHETNAAAAAEIVVRSLRERVGIDPDYRYRVGVETIWIQQMTDTVGFERIFVAALRSVGIASRLNEQNQAEFWTGTAWQAAPSPPSLVIFKVHGALANSPGLDTSRQQPMEQNEN
jgi:hypothetical protein